ncbi:MAG: Xaa-Pro aminopeptidase [Pirellulaceae bacterium]|jgi:Xaa-Pro aminopeptidase
MSDKKTAVVFAGIPATNRALYHRLRFVVGDPTAVLDIKQEDGTTQRVFILRDIEMDRARRHARADIVACPNDYAPESGLSGDRETATAQAAAECLRRAGVQSVVGDRSLPLIVADHIQKAGIEVICDFDLGVLDRRAKDAQEVDWLREAQAMTERSMEMACKMIANAAADADGLLHTGGAVLTSDRVRAAVEVFLLENGYSAPFTIVAGGPQGADCHDRGTGDLYTGQPVIIDIFPQNRETLYNGDCTRSVVHGEISAQLQHMHAAVVKAKAAATAATKPGATGQDVHDETCRVILECGYKLGLPTADDPDEYCAMTHGTGHGIGLDVHEPPLLDKGGPELVVGDALTIEPGLYCRTIGGIRVEDMVVVTEDGCENLNNLPEGLNWN